VFKATVYKDSRSKGFVGYGDADPSNTSPLVRGAEMRVAETRAINRAMRKAYGIGLCSVEELGSFSTSLKPFAAPPASGPAGSNGTSNGQPRLRDRLCLLIRQHNLDPALVKAYAADFCGTATLKDASRDLVQSFVTQLAVSAEKDKEALVCKLNSYAQPGGKTMKRHVPGLLHARRRIAKVFWRDCSWFASILLPTAGIRRNHSYPYALSFLSPNRLQGNSLRVGSIAPNEPCGS